MPSILDLIADLHDSDPDKRASAAAEIFRQGSGRAREAIGPWLRDSELRSSFFLGEDGFPKMTVGLAVEPSRFGAIRKSMGAPRLADVPAEHETQEFELVFSGGVSLDILTVLGVGSSGAIGRYLEKFGEGIQQVELLCRDVDRAVVILRERFGLTPLYSETRCGAKNTRVNFFLVPATEEGKLLIELVEPPQ